MNWKKHLKMLEDTKQWDTAIEFMQNVIKENPEDMDAYLLMNYLLMNLLVEEDYNKSKQKNYIALTKWYFDESYKRFSENAEYLYLTARTAVMGESFYGIDVEDYENMIKKAQKLDSDNLLYRENYYWKLSHIDQKSTELISYCSIVLANNSSIEKQLADKGSLGEYLLMLKKNWCKRILGDVNKLLDKKE